MKLVHSAPRVLVVEDNPATRMLIQSTLELEGYDVVCASDGARALGEIGSRKPDVVVLDVMMPGVDGFSVLERLRGEDKTKDLPVLMLTALDDNESTWKGWSGGCHYYMTKPFEIDDLLTAVRRLAEGAAA